jgi:chorismate dehydratase
MSRVRMGSVSYLNARPLVYELTRHAKDIALRFDVPSLCADLLHRGEIDLGLIPSLEYLRHRDYRVVPELGIVSDDEVASVALFTSRPIEDVGSIALDTSSRTSVGLLRLLCGRHFRIAPAFVPHEPDLEAMTRAADAALLIGDPALFAPFERAGLQKIDLGRAWRDMTGLPFVWAMWVGRADGPITPRVCRLLREARDRALTRIDEIAGAFGEGDEERSAIAAVYLRQNIGFELAATHLAGVARFFELAVEDGLAETLRPLAFFEDVREGVA